MRPSRAKLKPLDPFHINSIGGHITKWKDKHRVIMIIDGKRRSMGTYKTYCEAVRRFNEMQRHYYGDKARLKHEIKEGHKYGTVARP